MTVGLKFQTLFSEQSQCWDGPPTRNKDGGPTGPNFVPFGRRDIMDGREERNLVMEGGERMRRGGDEPAEEV